jgi:fructose-bisphosphate aldolase, class I
MEYYKDELLETTQKLCTEGKGILAADESTGTIGKRLSQINLENTLENRIRYRELLFNTPGLNKNISGVITYEETLKNNGLIKPLLDNNIVVGIKVDKGVINSESNINEPVTQGIYGLDERCQLYYSLGARFSKWRAVLKISDICPSKTAIQQNTELLAKYAIISQNNGLVPIIEPEILMDGVHTIEQCRKITQNVLSTLYKTLLDYGVNLERTILKPNMVRQGADNDYCIKFKDIAKFTLSTLQHVVPVAVPGIMFLSGGMSEMEATNVLNEINKLKSKKPWYLSFSYGRALQYSVLMTWKGEDKNINAAQKVLLERANYNGLATLGKY